MRLVKTQGLDGWWEVLQKSQPCPAALAGVANDIVETLFAADHHEMGDAARVAHAGNHGVAAQKIPINEEM